MVTMTSYRQQCLFSLLSPVYLSGEVGKSAHLLVSFEEKPKSKQPMQKEEGPHKQLQRDARATSSEAAPSAAKERSPAAHSAGIHKL